MSGSPISEGKVGLVAVPSPLKSKCRIEIMGRSYTLRGDTDEAYARELAAMVEHKMRKLAAQTKKVDVSSLAIFTAINLADELCSLKKEQEAHDALRIKRTNEMISALDDQLEMFHEP